MDNLERFAHELKVDKALALLDGYGNDEMSRLFAILWLKPNQSRKRNLAAQAQAIVEHDRALAEILK